MMCSPTVYGPAGWFGLGEAITKVTVVLLAAHLASDEV
jgi:hypothetical protein